MKDIFKFRLAGLCVMLAMFAMFGAVVMLMWNALMPSIFALSQISYPQAVGLLILARLLFGSMGGRHSHALHHGWSGHLLRHGGKLREKWMNMSDDERAEFMKKERDFFKFHNRFAHFHGHFGDEREMEQREKGGVKEETCNG